MARALYGPQTTAEGAAAFGMTLEEASGPPVEIWPDNLQTAFVFVSMSTQWRFGMAGPTGLDYAVLPEIWRRTHTAPADRDDVFEGLRVMEETALKQMMETAR